MFLYLLHNIKSKSATKTLIAAYKSGFTLLLYAAIDLVIEHLVVEIFQITTNNNKIPKPNKYKNVTTLLFI